MKTLMYPLLAGIALLASSCASQKTDEGSSGIGITLENIDTTVRPQDDFFKYVNGVWISRATIPPDQGRWGSFNELREFNNDQVLKVLKAAGENAEKYPDGTDQRKAADFYSIAMDSMLAENAGIEPLKPHMERIDAIKSKNDIQDYLATDVLNGVGGGAFFGFGVMPDFKNSKKMAAYVASGGIGLPERDYYLKEDAKSKETRERYTRFIANLLKHAGVEETKATSDAAKVLNIETQLAKKMLSKEDRRNPVKQYNPKTIAELGKLAPTINWNKYFAKLKVKEDTLIVTEPEFIKETERILTTHSLDDIKTYLRASLLRGSAPFLSNAFVSESFEFYSKYLRGTEQMRPRWKRVLDVTDGYLGEAIGKLYVDENFPPEAKQKALDMVENIKLAFADRLKTLDWMSDSTKEMALKKLSTFTVKIGYPDKWKDYSKLKVEKAPESASYFANAVNATRFQVEELVEKLGKPVDKTEWEMTPQTVNAYYNPLFNEIVFPAGILQPPFYNYKADEAVNYGGIGAVIGHEISHGFDDQGSQFDADGNLKNWWAEKDLTLFQQKGDAYAAQFDKYEPLPDVFVQGKFTLGENIGDLGGIVMAYEGLQRFYKDNEKPGLIDGLTPEQRFFISWGTIWRTKFKDEFLRTQVQTDPHAPAMYRANAPLSNFEPFYEAFNVKEGDKMFRPDSARVSIW
jgi:putative endopeptidase